jgi:hypothetical protein
MIGDFERIAKGANKHITLLDAELGAAVANVTSDPFEFLDGMAFVILEAKFVRAAGGTTCKVWVQTSLDDGVTWFDIACFAFTTTTGNKLHSVRLDPDVPITPATVPASATLADDTVLNGVLGNKLRTIRTTTGTYTGASSIQVHAVIVTR